MRKNVMIAIVAVVCSVCVYVSQERKTISDIALANVEALAMDEYAMACVPDPGDVCYSPDGRIIMNYSIELIYY